MTATTTTATWKSPSHHRHSAHARSSRPSTTPRGHPSVGSVGQAMTPAPSTQPRSPRSAKNVRSPSPSYFGLVLSDEAVPADSNPGLYTRAGKNNKSPSARNGVSTASKFPPHETHTEFEAFRRQSQQHAFNLAHNVAGIRRDSDTSQPSPTSPRSKQSPAVGSQPGEAHASERGAGEATPFFADMARQQSPTLLNPKTRSVADHQHARLSLPATELKGQLQSINNLQRSETIPHIGDQGNPVMAVPHEVARIVRQDGTRVLLLDLRVYPQYSVSRIQSALNLCIPTTLLKRPSFTVDKLGDTFTTEEDKNDFAKWMRCDYIIVYDAASSQVKEAVTPFNVLRKFSSAGWQGCGLVIKGGFQAFSKQYPALLDVRDVSPPERSTDQACSVSAPAGGTLAVAGGCEMPTSQSVVNPFFSNIRQNVDLVDGVGQMPVGRPHDMSERDDRNLPGWLREAANPADHGKTVADRFLQIEQREQKRMQKALSADVTYGSPTSTGTPGGIQIAGIEKGSKNRYNNIFPYDHTRVKLQNSSSRDCDYVNASHVKAGYSNRTYIATQAPIPATFNDFWRVVWEQDVRAIVMLTAESEGGQVKSHPYWHPGEYGQLKLEQTSERQSSLDRQHPLSPPLSSSLSPSSSSRPDLGPRRTTQPHTAGERRAAQEQQSPLSASDSPTVTVRHFALSHPSQQPSRAPREVVQLQYAQWPDFGAPASPTTILGLIDELNRLTPPASKLPSDRDDRPVMVHCSAGCGRTGTFCTIDSVIGMLQRQRHQRRAAAGRTVPDPHAMDVDETDDWLHREDIDLVAHTVEDFRHQRLSMVQNLRQFVLCYETVLQWLVTQAHEDPQRPSKQGRGRSYHGSMG